MEGLLNRVALEFAIRPHSYQARVVIRVLHEVSFGMNYVSGGQKLLLESFIDEAGGMSWNWRWW